MQPQLHNLRHSSTSSLLSPRHVAWSIECVVKHNTTGRVMSLHLSPFDCRHWDRDLICDGLGARERCFVGRPWVKRHQWDETELRIDCPTRLRTCHTAHPRFTLASIQPQHSTLTPAQSA